jgi:hypothetical protein
MASLQEGHPKRYSMSGPSEQIGIIVAPTNVFEETLLWGLDDHLLVVLP